MNVQRFSGPCKTQYQTARSILVFRVVLYDLTDFHGFTDLLYIDPAQNTLVDRMPGELKLTLGDLIANLMDCRHAGIIFFQFPDAGSIGATRLSGTTFE